MPNFVESQELSKDDSAAMKAMEAETPEIVEEAKPESETVEKDTSVEKTDVTEAPEAQEKPEKQARMIPLSELQEERERRRQAEDRFMKMVERLNPQQQQEEKKSPVFEIPDPEKDALGALKATTEAAKQWQAQQQQQAIMVQNQQAVHAVAAQAVAQERDYVKDNPDYTEAGNYLRDFRLKQLQAVGYTPQQAQQAVVNESIALANSMLQQGRSIPQAIHELAKSSGYVKKSSGVQITDAEKLANIAAGQKANISLSNANGVQQKTGALDAKAILAMPEDKFAEFIGKLSKSERQAMLGA